MCDGVELLQYRATQTRLPPRDSLVTSFEGPMSYRSIKRVLGETRLELKCLVLFGIVMCLLIASAFFLVERAAVRLVEQNTREKSRDLITVHLVKAHFEAWEGPEGSGHTPFEEREFVKDVTEEFGHTEFEFDVLVNDETVSRQAITPVAPDAAEIRLMEAMRKRLLEEQRRGLLARSEESTEGEAGEDAEAGAIFTPEQVETSHEERYDAQGNYQYYQPIVFSQMCRDCHYTQTDNLSSLESIGTFPAEEPLSVVRLTLPQQATRSAIYWTWAVLITLAILTVSAGVITLYLIIRYVIVKPLKHLREVSDQIRNGKMETRAELHTGDEFEELASSFNRMLRHLADSQSELTRANSDLDRKVEELAHLNMQLHEMNQVKSEFLANMSHELRTPLNSIIGFSEVLKNVESMTDKQRRYATNIMQSGKLLSEMINDILDLAKIEAGKMEVKPTEFKIETVVNAHCDMVRSLSEEKNIDLTVELDPDLPLLFQDQVKLQQILTNLLSNAIKFTPEGGRIVVSGKMLPEDRFELAVSDTGVGIAEDDRAVIFEKFRQGKVVRGDDNLTREYSGTGLGLSIVRELCSLLGGEVELESEVGRGSLFRIILPARYNARPKRESDLSVRLDELSRAHRPDFRLVNEPVRTS